MCKLYVDKGVTQLPSLTGDESVTKFLIMSQMQDAISFIVIEKLLGFKPKAIRNAMEKFNEDAQGFLSELRNSLNLRNQYEVDDKAIDSVIVEAEKEFNKLSTTVKVLIKGRKDYPAQLALIKNAPYILYAKGNVDALSRDGVAIVGSRKASESGITGAGLLAKKLGEKNYSVVSGLALGIDTSAHFNALKAGFHTTAVIGTPITKYYPKENVKLQDAIAERGTLVSQFSPLSKTQPLNFPMRNEVMSGLSLATVIVEAGETSGALTQAKYALAQKRQLYIFKNQLEKSNLSWPKRFVEQGARPLDSFEALIAGLNELKLESEISEKTSKQLSML